MTTAIARRHGHTGPTNCQDCGTTDNVHFGSWSDPKTGESGNFLQCCACGIKAGDALIDHADCGEPITQFVLNDHGNPYSGLAYKRVHARATEAYMRGQRDAVHDLDLKADAAHAHALSAVLEAVGRAYAAAALNQAAQMLIDKLDEDTYLALGEIAATLDLDVVEDLDGANGTGDDSPIVRVFRRDTGWTMTGPEPEECTTRFHRERDGRPACTGTAVWKVVTDHGLRLDIGFYCDTDLPAEHRPAPA